MSIYPASIDDNDPQVLYSSGWVLVTSDPPWTGTIHSTSQVGAIARVRFTGSRVAVVCTIPTGDGHMRSMASFSIDNGPAIQVAVVATPPVQYQYEFWNSDPLPMGSHLLVINNTGHEDYFRLDRIDYDPTDSNAPKSSTSLSVTSTGAVPNAAPLSSSATTAAVGSSTSGAATIAPSTSPLSSKSSVSSVSSTSFTSSMASTLPPTYDEPASAPANGSAATGSHSFNFSTVTIVAGVLGGLLFLVLLIALFIFCRRRNKRSIHPQTIGELHSSNSTIPRPFALNTYTDNPSIMLPSRSLVSPDHKQTSTALKDSSTEDILSTSVHTGLAPTLTTRSDSDPPVTPWQAPLALHIGRQSQVRPEKLQGVPSRTIERLSNTASEAPPAYSSFS